MSRFPIASSGLGRLALPSIGSPRALRQSPTRPSTPQTATGFRAEGLTRAVGHGLILGGLFVTGYLFLVVAPATRSFGFDAFAYWSVAAGDPYTVPLGSLGSFNYSPPAVFVADSFGSIDWWMFAALWTALLVGTIVWLGGSFVWVMAAFAFPPVALEVYHGNIHLLLAAAVVLGFRHPWTWAFVLLTKFTSAVGLLWFVVRGEWRSLFIALGTTAAVVVVTFAFASHLWADWIAYVSSQPQVVGGSSSVNVPLWLRLGAAAALVIWGARTDRRWTVIVAATLALPVLWIAGLAMLVGIIPELRQGGSRRRIDTSVDATI